MFVCKSLLNVTFRIRLLSAAAASAQVSVSFAAAVVLASYASLTQEVQPVKQGKTLQQLVTLLESSS